MKSNKIKKITLDCFRAFSSKKILDFEKKDAVADIVVIFAPNGTGKTSTIEGIEWATTGKISRIDRIITSNSYRNRNPKEGYILKNRQSSVPFATVSIELDNNVLITRSTKPKSNRNNDYCNGTIVSTIENLDSFGTNILSQGNINRFAYEASNGDLFNSLISSKDSLDDIKVYDQLISLKSNLDASNSDNRSKIALLNDLIDSEERRILDLKSSKVKVHGVTDTEEYEIFKREFTIFKDVSSLTLDEKILYANQTVTALQFIKEKLIEFDIKSYRNLIERISMLDKTIRFENEATKNRNIIKELKSKIDNVEKEIKGIDNFLLVQSVDNFSFISDNYKLKTVSINYKKNRLRKLNHIYESVFKCMSNINIDSIKSSGEEILHVENLLHALYYDSLEEINIIENESNYIRFIDNELVTLNAQLNLLSKDVFIARNPDIDEVKKLNAKLLELENINVKITQLTSEKTKLKSFEEKLSLIKSSIIDFVTENHLNDCPSCGTKFDEMSSLLNAVNSAGAGADRLFDNVLNDCNNQKSTISIELENLHKKIDSVIAAQVIKCNNEIGKLNEKKANAIKLYSLLSTLDINFIGVKLTDVIYQLDNKKKVLNDNLSNCIRKKEKYERWLNKIKNLLSEITEQLVYDESKQKQLMDSCIEIFGLGIDEVEHIFSYGHVVLFEKKRLQESIGFLYQLYDDSLANSNKLESKISEFRIQHNFSQDLDLVRALELALVNKKLVRTNYNYLKENIKSFKVGNALYFIDIITKLEGFFHSLSESHKVEKDAFDRQNLLDDYKLQKLTKEGELKTGAKNIALLNDSLDDALKYFSKLASDSINNDVLNDMFMYIEPHLKYDKIKFKVDLSSGNKGIYIQACSAGNNESTTPVYYLSEAQINILSICIFLADHARKIDCGINAIIIDDPVQSMDDLNSYALIDLCKLFARRFGKQVIITTHNRNFFNLFKEKLPESRYATKYICL